MVQSDYYWSATSASFSSNSAWVVNMYFGDGKPDNLKSQGDYVWPVLGTSVLDAPVPAVSEWGMIIFFSLLVGSALWVIRRRTGQESV